MNTDAGQSLTHGGQHLPDRKLTGCRKCRGRWNTLLRLYGPLEPGSTKHGSHAISSWWSSVSHVRFVRTGSAGPIE